MEVVSYRTNWNIDDNVGRVILTLADGTTPPPLELDAASFSAATALLFNSSGTNKVTLHKDDKGKLWLSTAERIA